MEPQQNQPPVIFGVLFFFLVLTTVIYQLKPSSDTITITEEIKEEIKNEIPIVVTAEDVKIIKKPKEFIPKFPHCKRNDSGELYELVIDLLEDVSKCNYTEVPKCNEEEIEARGGAIVIYTAVVCLMVSLGAAAVELYRHRSRLGAASSPTAAPHPPQLSRRCSLADLTVLRHNRRESMLRRDSSMHMSFEGTSLPGSSGQHHQRVPLKLLGSSKSQDDSFRKVPLATGKTCKWQRSISADKADESIPDVHHHRIHMIRHH